MPPAQGLCAYNSLRGVRDTKEAFMDRSAATGGLILFFVLVALAGMLFLSAYKNAYWIIMAGGALLVAAAIGAATTSRHHTA